MQAGLARCDMLVPVQDAHFILYAFCGWVRSYLRYVQFTGGGLFPAATAAHTEYSSSLEAVGLTTVFWPHRNTTHNACSTFANRKKDGYGT